MEIVNLLQFEHRSQLRRWLEENHDKEKSCWVVMYRSKQSEWQALLILILWRKFSAFGGLIPLIIQRLSSRRKKSHRTQLNMNRCMDLEDRGLMTAACRTAFEKARGYGYEIEPKDSPFIKEIQENSRQLRPALYKD